MALSKANALDAARSILTGARAAESERLEHIHRALKPRVRRSEFVPSVQIPDDAPPLMKELARKSATNYLPLLVKTFAQVMKVDGYISESDPEAVDPWLWWQRNRMDSRQTGLFRSALQYGVGYASVLPGTYGRGLPGPAVSLYSPREMTAVYQDPESDEWPMLALGVDQGFRSSIVTLIDETSVYRFGLEPGPWPGIQPALSTITSLGRMEYIGTSEHGLGVCPVVRFRDRNLLAGEEQYGIVEPLMTLQERIDEVEFQSLVGTYFQAFKMRYVIGWMPKNEAEELKAGAARISYLDMDPADVRVDQLEGGDGTLAAESSKSAKRDFAALGQIPVQTLGIDGISNISDATLAGLEAAKNREAGEMTTSLGEAAEQMLRLCAYVDGNEAASDDYSSEIRWRNFEARSFAQTVDGLVKLVQGLGLDPAIALEDVPGMTEQRLVRAQDSIRRSQGASVLALLNQTPSVDESAGADDQQPA